MLGLRPRMRSLIVPSGVLLLSLALSACSRPCRPAPPQVIEIPGPVQYRAIDQRYTQPCRVSLEQPPTNADLEAQKFRLEVALRRCDQQITSIRELEMASE